MTSTGLDVKAWRPDLKCRVGPPPAPVAEVRGRRVAVVAEEWFGAVNRERASSLAGLTAEGEVVWREER